MLFGAFRHSHDPSPAPSSVPTGRTARASHPLGTAHPLAQRMVRSFIVKRSLWLMCVRGELWLTTPDGRDHVLGTGDDITVSGPGKVVVEALRDSNLWVRAESAPAS
ncbi:MAG: DUF2917 domain-containing protein [Polyangiaceae bacterium]